MVPHHLMLLAHMMRDTTGEKNRQGIPVEADCHLCSRQNGQDSGSCEPLHIDEEVVSAAANFPYQGKEVTVLVLFIEHQNLPEIGMILQQTLISFSYQDVDRSSWEFLVKGLQDTGSQNDVTYECGLNDQNGGRFRHTLSFFSTISC